MIKCWTSDLTCNQKWLLIKTCSCWFPGYLDLPPVNVTAQRDNKVLISFENPSVYYCQKIKKNKKKCSKDDGSLDSFFKVKILNQVRVHTSSVSSFFLLLFSFKANILRNCCKVEQTVIFFSHVVIRNRTYWCCITS